MKTLILCSAIVTLAASHALATAKAAPAPGAVPVVSASFHGVGLRPLSRIVAHPALDMAPHASASTAGSTGGESVPEPGAIALASLGLIALGAATHRRRGL